MKKQKLVIVCLLVSAITSIAVDVAMADSSHNSCTSACSGTCTWGKTTTHWYKADETASGTGNCNYTGTQGACTCA